MRLFNVAELIVDDDAYGIVDYGELTLLNNWLHKTFDYSNNDFFIKKIAKPSPHKDIWLVAIKNDNNAMLFKLKWPNITEIAHIDEII